jgi:hypothetical protein
MPAETLKPRVDWLDEERRKDKALLGRMEEKLAAAEAALTAQSKQMQELSAQVARVYTKFQPGQVEDLLAHHREDLQHTIENLEKRRLDAEEKGAKLRSSEREANERALADMHRQLGALVELQRMTESRREEQARLASALQEARKTLEGLVRRDEERVRVIAAMEETRRQDIRRLGEIQGEMQAQRQKFNESGARLESLETGARRTETRLGELSAGDLERRNAAAMWQEQQNALASERERQWKEWERTLGALAASMKDYSERMEAYAERDKFNRMLQTSMYGGLSSSIQKGLRDYLLAEDPSLRNHVARMRENLEACRVTRQEIDSADKKFKIIQGVFKSGYGMFEAAFHGTRLRVVGLRKKADATRADHNR